MMVEASELQPGDRIGGRVVLSVAVPADDWWVSVRHRPDPDNGDSSYQSSFPRSLLLDVERPPKRWRITLETTDPDVVGGYREHIGTRFFVTAIDEVVQP